MVSEGWQPLGKGLSQQPGVLAGLLPWSQCPKHSQPLFCSSQQAWAQALSIKRPGFAWTGEVRATPSEPQCQGSLPEVQKHLEGDRKEERDEKVLVYCSLFHLFFFSIFLRFTGSFSLSLCMCQRCQRFQTLCGISLAHFCSLHSAAELSLPDLPLTQPLHLWLINLFCCFCSAHKSILLSGSCKFSKRWIGFTAFRN